jgi:hypothetical protein
MMEHLSIRLSSEPPQSHKARNDHIAIRGPEL